MRLATVLAGLALTTPAIADAQEAGDRIRLLVPAGIVVETSDDADKMVVIGTATDGLAVDGCSLITGDTTEYPVQTVVIVHPGGERASRVSGVVFLVESELRNSVRLRDLTYKGSCTVLALNSDYDKYDGTIE